MIRVGAIGLGYWGPNLVRCFSELNDCKVTMVCDKDVGRLTRLTDRYPGIHPTENADDVLSSDMVDAVVIATPTRTHHALAAAALDRGLHTFVEKPLATSGAECRDLIQRRRRTIAGCSWDMCFCTRRRCESFASWSTAATWATSVISVRRG